MINLGLCLHHPYQSAISQLRCLYVGNPGRSQNELSAQIQRDIPTHFRRGRPFKENISKLIEMRTGIPYSPNKYEKLSFKTCPKCWSLGYHSDIYNFSWLTACPLHPHESITAYCPSCQIPWPKFGGKIKNPCEICGDLTLKNLLKNNAFGEKWDFYLLAQLTNIVTDFDKCKLFQLYCEVGLRLENVMQNFNASCYFFPSILAEKFPILRDLFSDAQATLHDCRIEKGILTYEIDFGAALTKERARACLWNQQSKAAVSAIMLEKIKSRHSCKSKPVENWKSCDKQNICAYCIAVNTWNYFLNKSDRSHIDSIDIVSYELTMFYLSEYLLFPDSLPYVFIYQGVVGSLGFFLPQNIQQAIYELQLWVCFLNILKIVKSVLVRTENLTKSYPASLPCLQLEHPCFDIQNYPDNTIIAVIPRIGFGDL